MNYLQHPIRNLTHLIQKHKVDTRTNLPRIALFYMKLLLQEPFRILEKFKYADKVREHRMEKDPIFIIGHWRSGTSFLQYLLGRDPQFAYMNKFQVVFPDIFLHTEHILKPLIRSIPKTFNITRDAENMSINLELDSPSEIEIALTTIISPTSLHWGHIFPQNSREYFDKYLFFEGSQSLEVERWKEIYHHLIKKVSLRNDGQQVLIKSPGNTCRIEKLLELYPKARFIFIHRNPYDVFYSSKKLWNTLLGNLALQEFSEKEMENEIVYVYKRLMRSYLEQSTNIPDGQLTTVRFEDLMDDPVNQIHRVYENLDLAGFSEAMPGIVKFLDNQTSGDSTQYRYETEVVETINKEWSFAFSAFNYPMKQFAMPTGL